MPSTGNILDVAQGGKNDRDDCIGVLPCSVEVEKESQANAGSTRRSLSPNTEEVCPDHAQTARQNDSGLCVRQLRKDGQIDVVGVPHSQGLLPGTAAEKDSGVGPLANPQVTAKGIPGYLPSSPNRSAEILDVAPQQDSTFLPLASNGAIGFKVEEDGSKQAQLTTGTFGVTQSPWNVPNRPACSPSLDVADRATGNAPVTDGLQVGDEGGEVSSIASPLHEGLLIEGLINSVIRAEEHAAEIEQYRAEENDAAEECALIEASGYNDPASDRSFA